MEFTANEGKQVNIEVDGQLYQRHAIKTHFVQVGENYLDIIKKYVQPIYQEGDLVSSSEKIVSLCQGRVVKRADLPIGFWAKFLSRFANQQNRGGYGVGMAINMQYAINKVGVPRVLWASLCSALGKLVGKHGIFYEIVGQEVSGLDGFYDGAWAAYRDMGIEIPADPSGVCNQVYEQLGIKMMIVDANDFGQVILGKADVVKESDDFLARLIADNPAGQSQETTPLILVRKVNS